jgi:methyl-accepting chemotaxis protein
MIRFLNFSFRGKMIASFAAGIVLLAVVVGFAYAGIVSTERTLERVYHKEYSTAFDLFDFMRFENLTRYDLLSLMLQEKVKAKKILYQDIRSKDRKSLKILKRLFHRYQNHPGVLRQLKKVQGILKQFLKVRYHQLIPLMNSGESKEALALFLGSQHSLFLKLENASREMSRMALAAAQKQKDKAENKAQNFIDVFLFVAAGSVLAGLFLIVFLDRMIQKVTSQIKDGINVLASSSSQILAAATQLASGAAETATAVTQTTVTVEEVKQTSQVTKEKARYVTETAQKVSQISVSGKKSVEETVKGMRRIKEQIDSIAETMSRLTEQTQMIGEIASVVKDLAEQSNLLAVNAAIEAAKAGEQGKGFAVVAQEVRSLAEQSKQAANQVKTILGDIQKNASSAAAAIDEGNRVVETGVELSNESGEVIQGLTQGIQESANAATQIAASVQQQFVGSDQVAQAMESIKQASQQNAASTRQVETAASSLHDLGQKLKQIVKEYRF